MAERAYFELCRVLGRLLRSVTYSNVRVASHEVRKHRSFYAPALIWASDALVRILDAGVRVLPQREWEAREGAIYRSLYDASIRIDAGGTLVLPRLPGTTLAALLEDQTQDDSVRKRGIESAAVALAELHHRGFTHADAMAENVLVDTGAGVARWFDFETIHDERPNDWQRADDLRALLVTCLLRTAPEEVDLTLQHILDAYRDEGVARLLHPSFTSVWRRPLIYHLSQAALPFRTFRDLGRLLRQRHGR